MTIQEETARAIAAVEDFSYEYRALWPDGTVHWILARGAVVANEAGQAERLTGVNMEITAAKSAQEALAAANLELEQFAFMAGHDLQAPLRTVAVFAELLEQMLASSADQKIQER